MANVATTVTLLLAASAIIFLAVSNKRVNEAAVAKKNDIEKTVANKDEEIRNCQKSVGEKSELITNLKAQVDSVKQQIQQVQNEINPIAGISEKDVETLSNELAGLQKKYEEVNAELANLGSPTTLSASTL